MIHELTDRSIAVEVPEGAWRFYSNNGIASGKIGMDVSERLEDGSLRMYAHKCDLPPGSWSILGKGNEITEEQWKTIVGIEWFEDDDEYFYIYEPDGKVRSNLFYDTAIESGLSLLKSKSLNPESIIILIKAI